MTPTIPTLTPLEPEGTTVQKLEALARHRDELQGRVLALDSATLAGDPEAVQQSAAASAQIGAIERRMIALRGGAPAEAQSKRRAQYAARVRSNHHDAIDKRVECWPASVAALVPSRLAEPDPMARQTKMEANQQAATDATRREALETQDQARAFTQRRQAARPQPPVPEARPPRRPRLGWLLG